MSRQVVCGDWGVLCWECKMKELELELGHDVTVLGSRAQASSSAGTGVGSRPHR